MCARLLEEMRLFTLLLLCFMGVGGFAWFGKAGASKPQVIKLGYFNDESLDGNAIGWVRHRVPGGWSTLSLPPSHMCDTQAYMLSPKGNRVACRARSKTTTIGVIVE